MQMELYDKYETAEYCADIPAAFAERHREYGLCSPGNAPRMVQSWHEQTKL